MAKAKTRKRALHKSTARRPGKTRPRNDKPSAFEPSTNDIAVNKELQRLFPTRDELKALYQRYTNGAAFDDHDKAFYFVLDVGGTSRAKQLIAHVEEVFAELEDFEG